MKIILSTIGSSGDVFPFLGLGTALVGRGHEVVLLTNEHFTEPAERLGIRIRATSSNADYEAALENPDLFSPREGFRVIAGYVGQQLGVIYRALEAEYEPGRSVIVAHWLDFASRTFQDRHAAPLVTALLQPQVLRSVFDTPAIRVQPDINRLPHWAKRGLFWAADRWLVDPVFAPPVNALRATVGLRRIHRPLDGWMFSPLLTLGWWPEFFAPPQPDWPASVRITGFPLFDTTEAVPHDVEDFLNAGDPPLVFTLGTANTDTRRLFETAVQASARLGRRGLFLARVGDWPKVSSDQVHAAQFAPLSQILHRCAALIHHGGIGTTAAALAAGVPQLITPLSHDQPDQAVRVKRLGVGDWLLPTQVDMYALAARLRLLLEEPAIAARCAELAQLTCATDGIARSVELIEAVSWPDGRDAHARAAGAAARDR
jgi:rhamnosyltransferase subunit B